MAKRLKVVDLRDVKKKLKDAEFEETTWENLGRELGLHPNTLAKIIANKTDVESRFTECLTKWLMRVDDVDSIGEPTYNSLIAALKKMDGTKDVFEALIKAIQSQKQLPKQDGDKKKSDEPQAQHSGQRSEGEKEEPQKKGHRGGEEKGEENGHDETDSGSQGKIPELPDDGVVFEHEKKELKDIKYIVDNIKILLAPATKGEEEAVLRYLKPIEGDKYFKISIYGHKVSDIHIGKYGEYPVVVVKTAPSQHNQGPIHAAIVITKMLEIFTSIKYIVGVGVCYGMNKEQQKLGEVIVSTILCDFTNIREGLERSQRGAQPCVDPGIKNIFEPTKEISLKLLPKSIIVTEGVYICTPSLIDNDRIKEEYRNTRKDAKAGEMEGTGLLAATEYTKEVKAIVIKGIGDWGDGDKEATKGWKPFAAHAAAYYVKTVLETKTVICD